MSSLFDWYGTQISLALAVCTKITVINSWLQHAQNGNFWTDGFAQWSSTIARPQFYDRASAFIARVNAPLHCEKKIILVCSKDSIDKFRCSLFFACFAFCFLENLVALGWCGPGSFNSRRKERWVTENQLAWGDGIEKEHGQFGPSHRYGGKPSACIWSLLKCVAKIEHGPVPKYTEQAAHCICRL